MPRHGCYEPHSLLTGVRGVGGGVTAKEMGALPPCWPISTSALTAVRQKTGRLNIDPHQPFLVNTRLEGEARTLTVIRNESHIIRNQRKSCALTLLSAQNLSVGSQKFS